MSLLEKECVALSPQLGPLRILPLHAGVGGGAQRLYDPDPELPPPPGGGVGASPGWRKVVVADALAEASFSLSGVRYVIDTGLQLSTVSAAPPAPAPPRGNKRFCAGLQPADPSQLPRAAAHQQRASGHAAAARQQQPAR